MKKYFFPLLLLVLFACKEDDPCEGITCLNNGICLNGICDCPDSYTGAACQDLQTPSKMRVRKVTVTKFPATESNGAGWDLLSGPDIYFDFGTTNTTYYSHNNFFQNADPSLNYDFFPDQLEINDVEQRHIIRLFDFDDIDADDWMGGVEFTPFNSSGGFPEELRFEAANLQVWFVLEVDYEF